VLVYYQLFQRTDSLEILADSSDYLDDAET